MRNIPEELLELIFEYCEDPCSILAIEKTCKEWRGICYKFDRSIWEDRIKELWEKFEMNRPNDLSVLQRIAKLSTGKMIKMLRHIDLGRCIEKTDYQRMLFAKIVFEECLKRELGGEDPRFKGRYLSMYYPDWSLIVAPFKASYFYTVKEIQRNLLHVSELCSIQWRFRFKHYADAAGMTFATVYYEDGTMYSEVQQQHYQWRFITVNNSETRIQVDQYPPLSMKRLATGAWQLENQHVIMDQVVTLDPEDLPLL